MANPEDVAGRGGFEAQAGRQLADLNVNKGAVVDASGFKQLNAEFKELKKHINDFSSTLPKLIKDTEKWATALNNVAKGMKGISKGGKVGGSYIPEPGTPGSPTTVGSGNQAQNQQIVNVQFPGGGGGNGTGAGAGGAGKFAGGLDIANQIIGPLAQALEGRIARGYSYSLSADKMNMLYQQMSGLSQNQAYHRYREPLQQFRLGMGGINEVLGLQASTGLNAVAQAKSIDAMRAASGYAYSTRDLVEQTRQLASPEVANRMFMMMGTGMYGIGGQQRTQQAVFQDIIQRQGLTTEARLRGARQLGSTTREALRQAGVPEDQIDQLLQYAQENIQYQARGGKGFYDPSKKSQRQLMGVEANFASQQAETERVKVAREENFYKRQNDNFAQMEKNIQAVNKALQAFEEKLSGITGARISSKQNIGKGLLKWGISATAGAVAGYFSGGLAAGAVTMGTKQFLDNTLGDGWTGDGNTSTPNAGGNVNASSSVNTTSTGSTPANVRKSEAQLSRLNPNLAARIRKMLEANPRLYIGGGTRTSAQQKALFLSRYQPTDKKTKIKWNGQYWEKKDPNVPDAAPPGISMHEIGMAADIHGDDDFLNKHAKDFGLINFTNVNNEPWHVQPVEFPKGQWEYRQAGAPWGVGGSDSGYDPNTEVNGQSGAGLNSLASDMGSMITSSGMGTSSSSSVSSSGSSVSWGQASMNEIVAAGKRGDGMVATPSMSQMVGKTSPIVLASLGQQQMSGSGASKQYTITIAPNITVQGSNNAASDAQQLARELSSLIDRDVRLNILRSN